MTARKVSVGGNDVKSVEFANNKQFALIAGPCQMESLDHAMMITDKLCKITDKLGIEFVFKASFDKANRTSAKSKRGIGLEKTMKIFERIRKEFGCPVITDIHKEEQCSQVAETVDLLQIPAFLCRQTDLLKAAAETGKPINIKKGQFMAPWDMGNVIKKMQDFNNDNILLCERGVSFGYNTLISDMRALPIMKSTGYPVIFDATHSVQQPGGAGEKSGGERRFVETLARAAIAVGVAGVFMEVHEDPDNAPSDGPNMVHLHNVETLLRTLKQLDEIAKEYPQEI